MTNKRLLTIGIPAYNEEANIGNLIRVLLNQKQTNFILNEILVISDGSTDETCKIVREINDDRIKIFDYVDRKGENYRLNELLQKMSADSTDFFLIEADTLPQSEDYINTYVSYVPEDSNYSMIVTQSIPQEPINFFNAIVNYGFYFRKRLFEECLGFPNLYVSNGNRLFSKKFIKNFSWSLVYHEDSYCYREALNSGLPIIYAKSAECRFKNTLNLKDYLLQSGKFQKARSLENNVSDIYVFNVSLLNLLKIFVEFFFKNPVLMICYLFVFTLSQINSLFLPTYTPFWKIYCSTKKVV